MFHRTLFALAAACLATALFAVPATAQSWRFQFHSGGWPGSTHHHAPVHTPRLSVLDDYSDQLSKIVRHLHDDAHQLSQDYHHSASIENTVAKLDDLKQHMHEMLHQAARHDVYSSSLDRHIKSDLREVKTLLYALEDELSHQNSDGARASDFRAIQHMQHVLAAEALPWLRLMEKELYGSVHGDSHSDSHHWRSGSRRVIAQPRFEQHSSSSGRSGFRFSF